MDLPRAGQEYAYVTLANEPDAGDPVEASVDSCLTWAAVEVANAQAQVLLRGPDYRDDERGLLIPATATNLWLRVKSNPEAIPRIAAVVFLY